MTLAAQFRLPSSGTRTFDDKTATTTAPDAITIGAFPADMIGLRDAKHLGLMAYGIQSSDNGTITVDLFGVFGTGKPGAVDAMYFSALMQTGIVFTLADGAAASGEGFIGSEFAFADTITLGSEVANGLGAMLDTLFAEYNIDAVSLADDDTPALLVMTQLGPLIGIVPHITAKAAGISVYNFLSWRFS